MIISTLFGEEKQIILLNHKVLIWDSNKEISSSHDKKYNPAIKTDKFNLQILKIGFINKYNVYSKHCNAHQKVVAQSIGNLGHCIGI